MKKKAPPMSMPPTQASPMADMAPTATAQPAAAPAVAPAPAPMAAPSVARGTHNPDNLLPGHAFHGKKR